MEFREQLRRRRRPRQHKSAVTPAGDHDITDHLSQPRRKHNVRPLISRQNSEPRRRLVHFGSPPHHHRQRQPDMCLIRQEQASTARRSWRSHERDLAIFFGVSDPQSQAVTRKAEPRDPPNAQCTGINWTCIGGYNHLTFIENMRAVVFVFVHLSWRRGLCAKKPRRATAIDRK